jgi:iron complex outermembrane receptor protein
MMKQVKFKFPVRMLALICGLFLSIGAFAQQLTVNGHVKDATGEAIIGATVRVVGQTGGTITDFDGNFVIKASQGDKISVSYIGYQEAIVAAAPTVNITLQDDAAQSLNEVVVIGYGVAKKGDLTGSVTAIKPDEKNHGLITSAQDMMQGKIAGVNVTNGGGTPGGGATIRIRGGSSLNASNDPLIVIDGLAMDNQGIKGAANPLSMVNPNDIESFTVLKDASATAIYGSRGSNGVIIITTKK